MRGAGLALDCEETRGSPRLAAMVTWRSQGEEGEVWLVSRELEDSLQKMMALVEEVAGGGGGLARVRAVAAAVCREGARVLARDQLRGLVTAGVEVTAQLVQPREGRLRLYLGGVAVCPPPQVAVARPACRLRPGGSVLGVARLAGQGELCVQVLALARAVSAALASCGSEGEGVLVLELCRQPRRLVCYGEGRLLSVDTGQDLRLPGPLSLLPCPAST